MVLLHQSVVRMEWGARHLHLPLQKLQLDVALQRRPVKMISKDVFAKGVPRLVFHAVCWRAVVTDSLTLGYSELAVERPGTVLVSRIDARHGCWLLAGC